MSWNPGWFGGGGESSGSSGGGTVTIQSVTQATEASLAAVTICNAALSKLGADHILALTDDTKRAKEMNLRYPTVRDAELHRYRWKFSIKRASLPALSSVPTSDYDLQYQLPSDYLRLIEGGDITDYSDLTDYRGGSGRALFSVEGNRLLTNLGAPLYVRYIARITDVRLMNASFVESLAAKLADETCETITGSSTKRQLAKADYKDAIREAKRANAIEAPPQSFSDDTWVTARRG